MGANRDQFLKLKEATRWSQAEIARQIELSPAAVSQIVKGTNEPSARTLELFRIRARGELDKLLIEDRQGKGKNVLLADTLKEDIPDALRRIAVASEVDDKTLRRLNRLPKRRKERLITLVKTLLDEFSDT